MAYKIVISEMTALTNCRVMAADTNIVASRLYGCANEAKASFDAIYNAPDPRGYYRELGALDYQIPTQAKPVFKRVMRAMGRDRLSVMDIGCSYGINAAMLRYDLTFSDLVERYSSREMEALSSAEVVCADARDYAARPRASDAKFIGVEVSREAAGYARAVGLLDDAIIENFEESPMSDEAKRIAAGVDLIITTGAVGYVTERTFSRLVDAVGARRPWVAAFTLRQFPFDSIAEELKTFDLETEHLKDRRFMQRAFRDRDEQEGAIEAVRAAGRNPDGLETTGKYFAEFYLARPRMEITTPLGEMGLA